MNPDEAENLEGWTDYPVMILKVPPKVVLTWVLGKEGKMVKALQIPLKGHLKKTNETATKDMASVNFHSQITLAQLWEPKPLYRTECSSPDSYGSPAVAIREFSIKGLPYENSEFILTACNDTSISVK